MKRRANENVNFQSKRFDEKRAAFYITELVLGLEFLHDRVSPF